MLVSSSEPGLRERSVSATGVFESLCNGHCARPVPDANEPSDVCFLTVPALSWCSLCARGMAESHGDCAAMLLSRPSILLLRRWLWYSKARLVKQSMWAGLPEPARRHNTGQPDSNSWGSRRGKVWVRLGSGLGCGLGLGRRVTK
jgi:hypothetical protein